MDSQLFLKNFEALRSINEKLRDISPDKYQYLNPSSGDSQTSNETTETWEEQTRRFLVMPSSLLRDKEIFSDLEDNAYKNFDQKFEGPFEISRIIDCHEDLHVIVFVKKLLALVDELGFDSTISEIEATAPMNSLLAFGTGDGLELLKLIRSYQPLSLQIIVAEWEQVISSFWNIDWVELYKMYSKSSRSINIVRVSSRDELNGVLYKELGLLRLDCACLYIGEHDKNSVIHQYSEDLFGHKIYQQFNYLGYTIDEYNMIYNSAKFLSRAPKILKRGPDCVYPNIIVCASGPSLDSELAVLQELQSTHIVIAAGSSIATLLANNIRVDFLALNERADSTYDDYKSLSQSQDLTSTTVVCSTTCPYQLDEIFGSTVVFFRPALSPLAVFGTGISEVLECEGPEAINTAISLAISFNPKSVALFGCDLGAVSLDHTRSKSAVGYANRDFSIEVEGNFEETVFSSNFLMDSKNVIDSLLEGKDHVQVYNCSNGVKLKYTKTLASTDYLNSDLYYSSSLSPKESCCKWLNGLPNYSIKRLKSAWNSRIPRSITYSRTKELIEILNNDNPWFPNTLSQIEDCLTIASSLKLSFYARMARGLIIKSTSMVSHQMFVMKSRTDMHTLERFASEAKALLRQQILALEIEIYDLCDKVEEIIDSASNKT